MGPVHPAHLLLMVSDLKRSEAFYVGRLGFHVRERAVRSGRAFLSLEEGLGLTEGGAPGGGALEHVAFRYEGIDALYASLREIAEGAPAANRYGRSFYVHDPDGHRIELLEVTGEERGS